MSATVLLAVAHLALVTIVVVGATRRSDARAALRPPAIGLGVAVAVTAPRAPTAVPVVLAVACWAAVALAVFRPTSLERLARTVDRAARAMASAVGSVLIAILAVPVVVLPWGVHRLARWNSLAARDGTSYGWSIREAVDARPDRLSLVEAVPTTNRRRRAGARLWATGIALTAVAVLVEPLIALRNEGIATFEAESKLVARAQRERAPWHQELVDSGGRMWRESTLSQSVGLELPDLTSRYLNITDGQRRTWQPPGAACQDVWMFGGSTTFGVDQRDDHTIASELAKVAWEQGHALRVTNFGVPGDVAWQQERRLDRQLVRTGRSDPPDLVVFYDGANDIVYVDGMASIERPRPGDAFGELDFTYMRVLSEMKQRNDSFSAELPPVTFRTDNTPEEVAAAVLGQYLDAHRRARDELAELGVPLVSAFQPTVSTRAFPVSGEPVVADRVAAVTRLVREALPAGFVDLGDTFDDITEPVYTDDVHTDERSTLPIARRLYAEVAAALPPDRAPC